MAVMSIRSLESGDDGVLAVLASDAADFGLSNCGDPLPALDGQQSARYLSDSSVIHWVAFDDGEILGSLVTIALPLPISPGAELLLYERRGLVPAVAAFRTPCHASARAAADPAEEVVVTARCVGPGKRSNPTSWRLEVD
jgi:hypothetical protein